MVCRKVLKQIAVAELQPDETVDAVREARLLAKVSKVAIGMYLLGSGFPYKVVEWHSIYHSTFGQDLLMWLMECTKNFKSL